MKIEHVAFMVAEPVAEARWFIQHLHLTVKRASDTPPYGHFLADEGGAVLVEFYGGPSDKIPNYAAIDPSVLHLALISPDIARDYRRLLAAGATEFSAPAMVPNGDAVAMLRDPWGLPVQLVQRARSMLG